MDPASAQPLAKTTPTKHSLACAKSRELRYQVKAHATALELMVFLMEENILHFSTLLLSGPSLIYSYNCFEVRAINSDYSEWIYKGTHHHS